jgi:hypothetical protein
MSRSSFFGLAVTGLLQRQPGDAWFAKRVGKYLKLGP